VSAAIVEVSGQIRQLDKPATSEQRTVAKDVQDPETLARLIQQLRDEVATLKRAFAPKRLDFDRITTTGTSIAPETVRFPHGFNGRVRYWPIGWESSGGVALDYIERTDTSGTDASTLVLYVYSAGVLSLRIEEVG
jgi:hypothetical protein